MTDSDRSTRGADAGSERSGAMTRTPTRVLDLHLEWRRHHIAIAATAAAAAAANSFGDCGERWHVARVIVKDEVLALARRPRSLSHWR